MGSGSVAPAFGVPVEELLPPGRGALPPAQRVVAHPLGERARILELSGGRSAADRGRGAGEPVQRGASFPRGRCTRTTACRSAPRRCSTRAAVRLGDELPPATGTVTRRARRRGPVGRSLFE